jgi:hypothetical protein
MSEVRDREFKLSKHKWKVQTWGSTSSNKYWQANTEDEKMTIKNEFKGNLAETKKNWEQFAGDNKIKYFVYV